MRFMPLLPLPAPILVPLVAWLIAQTLKIVIARIRRQHTLATYLAPGGMPSVHTATATATVVMVGLVDGWGSTTAAVAGLLWGLVLFDALVVRTQSGKQAAALNRIQAHLFTKTELLELKEIIGHGPLEILAGLVLGVVIALVFTPVI